MLNNLEIKITVTNQQKDLIDITNLFRFSFHILVHVSFFNAKYLQHISSSKL